MFGDNLLLLHWNLRKAGWLDMPEQCSFSRPDADFQSFVAQKSDMTSNSKTSTKSKIYLKPHLSGGTTKLASMDR